MPVGELDVQPVGNIEAVAGHARVAGAAAEQWRNSVLDQPCVELVARDADTVRRQDSLGGCRLRCHGANPHQAKVARATAEVRDEQRLVAR